MIGAVLFVLTFHVLPIALVMHERITGRRQAGR